MTIKSKIKNEGFTLTELLVVVAIVGLLLVLAAGVFVRQIAKGNDSRRKADLNRIKIAVEEYEKDHDCYPSAASMVSCGTGSGIAVHPYLSNVPCDPRTKQPYYYEMDTSSSCPKWFRLYTNLENTKDSQYIQNIGPNGLYSFYISSENAPVPSSGTGTLPSSGTTPPTGSCTQVYYGCLNHQCVQLSLDTACNPVCQPYYDGCYGQCEDPTNPAPECVVY